MPKATTFSSINPGTGEVITRTSKTHHYTHAVWARHTASHLIGSLQGAIAFQFKEAQKYKRLAATGGEFPTQQYLGWASNAETIMANHQKSLDALKANPQPGPWFVIGWCGRPDLAHKMVAKWSKHAEAQAVEATVVVAR